MNEENGLKGGKTYDEEHSADIGNHFAAIETDLGAGHPLGVYMAGKPELKALLDPVAKILQSSGAGLLQFRNEVGADIDPCENAASQLRPIQIAGSISTTITRRPTRWTRLIPTSWRRMR
jgi:hypothetical protein